MKKIQGYIVIIFVLLSFFSCVNNSEVTTIKVKSGLVNLGNIRKGEIKEATFEIENIGNHDLIIKDIKPDCYCTIPSWEKKAIPSGNATQIRVKVHKEFKGIFQQTVRVEANIKDIWLLLIVRGKIV